MSSQNDQWRIVFMGTPQTAAATLQRLAEDAESIVGVVTRPDRPAGRGQKSAPSSVRKIAESLGFPVIAPESVRTQEFIERLKAWAPDIIVVVAYGRILPKSVLDLTPHGCVNVHYSLLPKYRGAAPAAWTIINGEREGGVTTMRLVEKMDAGPIYLQRSIALSDNETTGSLQTKLTSIGVEVLLETLHGLKQKSLAGREQDEASATLAPLLKKEDGLIDWSLSAEAIERRVRGLTPWPGAFTQIDGKVLKVHRAKVLADYETVLPPGTILRADTTGFCVATGVGALALEEVQLENRKRLRGAEFVKGARVEAGDHLR